MQDFTWRESTRVIHVDCEILKLSKFPNTVVLNKEESGSNIWQLLEPSGYCRHTHKNKHILALFSCKAQDLWNLQCFWTTKSNKLLFCFPLLTVATVSLYENKMKSRKRQTEKAEGGFNKPALKPVQSSSVVPFVSASQHRINRKPQSIVTVACGRNRKTQTGNDAFPSPSSTWTRQRIVVACYWNC